LGTLIASLENELQRDTLTLFLKTKELNWVRCIGIPNNFKKMLWEIMAAVHKQKNQTR
jgi:hypothetical protein